METKALKPTSSLRLQSRIAVQRAPPGLDEADAATLRHGAREGGIHADERTHHAEAVGADDADSVSPSGFEDTAFQFNAFWPDLFETGGDDNDALHTCGGAFFYQAGNGRGRGHDDRKVDWPGDSGDCRISANAEDAGALRIDGKNRSPKGIADQVPEDGPANAASFSRTDDGDVLWLKKDFERISQRNHYRCTFPPPKASTVFLMLVEAIEAARKKNRRTILEAHAPES